MPQQEKFLRFPLSRRLEHWTMVISFTILAVTGLIQRFSQNSISDFLFTSLGGVESVRIIHRVSAVVLMLITIYHFGELFYGWYVKRVPLSMLPDKKDVIAAWKQLRYNLGFEKSSPKQGFFTFEEKFEYWALMWGTILMGITGFFLWNPIISAKILPGEWIPVAKAAHGNEAVLAVLAVAVWHSYHVLIKHFNTSMYFGTMTREEMEHYHPLVLEEDPYSPPSKSDPSFKRRKRNFTLVYGIISVVMLAAVYGFITVEETAVISPPEMAEIADIDVYSPADPTPYPSPTTLNEATYIGTSWKNGFRDLFTDRCGGCHKSVGGFAGLDLTTYHGALQGGNSGPALRPGASGISLVVIWPSRGDHPGTFDASEMAEIREWIDAGAPEE
jgi:cytochrome b subunit of formate dehydrogenase